MQYRRCSQNWCYEGSCQQCFEGIIKMSQLSLNNRFQVSYSLTRLLPLMFLLILAGCATTGIENVKKLDSDHRIIVVSALGNDFQIKSIGTTIFNNWSINEDVSDWAIDDRVESLVKQRLNLSSKLTVIPFDASPLRPEIGQIKVDDWSGARVDTQGMKTLLTAAKAAGTDSVLLVGTNPMTDTFHMRLSTIKGYGIYQSSFLGLKDSVNFIVLRIWLIDVNTGKDIAKIYEPGSSSRNSAVWLEKDMPLDEATNLEIRKGFETMLDSAVEEALKGLSLI